MRACGCSPSPSSSPQRRGARRARRACRRAPRASGPPRQTTDKPQPSSISRGRKSEKGIVGAERGPPVSTARALSSAPGRPSGFVCRGLRTPLRRSCRRSRSTRFAPAISCGGRDTSVFTRAMAGWSRHLTVAMASCAVRQRALAARSARWSTQQVDGPRISRVWPASQGATTTQPGGMARRSNAARRVKPVESRRESTCSVL
jgi:hypothetical protein